ncbi:hypothetical protein MYU51_001455 [Penicillium brevicompactum]
MDNLRRMAERHLERLRRRTKDDTLILDLRDLTNAIIEEEAVLSDYDLAMGRTTTTEASSRSRIDAIILLTLAQMKKDVAADPRSSVSSVSSAHSLNIQQETYVSMPWEFPDGLYVLRGKVDCSVCYETALEEAQLEDADELTFDD